MEGGGLEEGDGHIVQLDLDIPHWRARIVTWLGLVSRAIVSIEREDRPRSIAY